MTFKKTSLTLRNSLYGDQTIRVYAKDGVAVGRVSSKEWGVFCVSTESEVWSGLRAATKAVAIERANRLLALPVEWEKPFEEMKYSFAQAADAIRNIGSY